MSEVPASMSNQPPPNKDAEMVRQEIERLTKEGVEKRKREEFEASRQKELGGLMTKTEFAAEMAKILEELKRRDEAMEAFKTEVLRAKAQGEAMNFQQNDDKIAQLRKMYPNLPIS